jgi:phage baseplate assembly protein W
MKAVAIYTNDFFTIKEDEDAIKESISRILVTLPGERVNNPTFGSKVREFIFQLDVILEEDITSEIQSAVTRWEPRVTIENIITGLKDERTFIIKLNGIYNESLEPFTYEQIIRL